MTKDKISDEVTRESLEMLRIAKLASQKAQDENRRLGLPNTYSRNSVNYYELPDGTITSESPFKKDDQKTPE